MTRRPPRPPAPAHPRKPIPERYGPARGWSGLVGEGGGPAPAKPRRPRAAKKDAVSEGVDLGYRVIHQYLRQGERFARSFWQPGDEEQQQTEPSRLLDQAMRSAQDLAGAFTQMVRMLASTAEAARTRTPGPNGAPGGFDFAPPAQAPAAPGPYPVSVEVDSLRPVKVALTMAPGLAGGAVRVPPLRKGKRGRVLKTVTAEVEPGGRRVLVRVQVPSDLAAGTYSGPVVDAKTGEARGSLSVRVGL